MVVNNSSEAENAKQKISGMGLICKERQSSNDSVGIEHIKKHAIVARKEPRKKQVSKRAS